MSDTRSACNPFDIPKLLVCNAYQKVKANKGAAGVDGESLAEFAQNEKNNLYKFPQDAQPPRRVPVRRPAENAGTRI